MVISQIGHGFEVSDLVGLSGNYFVKCRAFSRQEAEVYGIVTRIVGANEFEITVSGLVSNLTGLVDDSVETILASEPKKSGTSRFDSVRYVFRYLREYSSSFRR